MVIYNHGSRAGHDREERPFAYVGEMLTRSGYVVIVPERRGYGKSDGEAFGETIGEDRGPRFVTRVQEETDDVLAAVEFVKTLPYADTKRMGVMGWSFGGIVSVFAASRSAAFRAVVDQAGAARGARGSRSGPAERIRPRKNSGASAYPKWQVVSEAHLSLAAVYPAGHVLHSWLRRKDLG